MILLQTAGKVTRRDGRSPEPLTHVFFLKPQTPPFLVPSPWFLAPVMLLYSALMIPGRSQP